MKVFISQSLPRSLSLATTLESFIRKVVPGTEPWVSESGIDKGARFMSEIRDNLSQAMGGIVCLTRENLNECWLLYEAGALSTKVTDRVWTFLLDVDHAEVDPPLSEFLHTKAEKADVLKMVRSIHKSVVAAGEKTSTEPDLENYFDAFWPSELEPKIAELRAQNPIPRPQPEPLTEILGLVRQIGDRAARSSWRQDKTLAMLHQVYRVTVGGPSPSLEELKEMQRQQAALDALRAVNPIAPPERQD